MAWKKFRMPVLIITFLTVEDLDVRSLTWVRVRCGAQSKSRICRDTVSVRNVLKKWNILYKKLLIRRHWNQCITYYVWQKLFALSFVDCLRHFLVCRVWNKVFWNFVLAHIVLKHPVELVFIWLYACTPFILSIIYLFGLMTAHFCTICRFSYRNKVLKRTVVEM